MISPVMLSRDRSLGEFENRGVASAPLGALALNRHVQPPLQVSVELEPTGYMSHHLVPRSVSHLEAITTFLFVFAPFLFTHL